MRNFEISESEEFIFELICKNAPISMADIFKLAKADKDWSDSTIKTFVNRLAKKGALTFKKDKVKMYSPACSMEEYKFSLLKNLRDQKFKGSSANMVLNYISNASCSEQELAELKKIIDDYMEGMHDNTN